MHQQKVLRIGFKPNLVGDACRHRYSRNSSRPNQRIEFGGGETVHQFRHQHPSCGADTKRYNTEHQNADGLRLQELISHQLGADGQAKENGHYVDEGVLRRVG